MKFLTNAKQYIKVILGIFLAFILSALTTTQVFPTQSPKIRENIGSYLANEIKTLPQNMPLYITSLFQKTAEDKLKNLPLQNVAQGVYAKEDTTTTYREYKDGEVNWKEYTFNVDGKEVKIKVADGDAVPTKEEVTALEDATAQNPLK